MPLRPFLLASASLMTFGGQAHAFTLNILHINDFHSRIESITEGGSTCDAEGEAAGECFGGMARLATAINETRDARTAAGESVLVLDAGDRFSGSLFFTTFQGQAEAEFLNAIGFDALGLGNHEFDLGPAPLADFIDTVEAPVAFGNVDAHADPLLGPLDPGGPVIVDVDGVRIAILNVTTPETVEIASPGPNVVFADPVAYLTEAVAALDVDRIDHIVVMSHVGALQDIALAKAVPGIDVIVGGHSHTLFSNTDPDAPYDYPTMVEGPGGVAVPVVSAGSYSKHLGHLTLTFDENGVVTAATGDTRLLDASVTPDPAILARIGEMGAPIEALKAEVVAEVGAAIDGGRESCRTVECAMGNLVTDAMLDRVKDQGVTIALQNGGGLRASIDAGVVTKGDVLTVLPFQNTLSTFNITGAGIRAALENGVSQVEEGAGRFLQVGGLKYTWDASAEPGARVTAVMVQEGDAWVPLDAARTYSAVTNDFMRKGGDGFDVLRDEATEAYDFGPGLEDVLADYLASNPGYTPYTDGRIARIE